MTPPTLELDPSLVAICGHVGERRKLPLRAIQGDAGSALDLAGKDFDLVTMISVLEHMPQERWNTLFQNVARGMRPGGWFCLTFNYGDYETEAPFGRTVPNGCRPAAIAEQGATDGKIPWLNMVKHLVKRLVVPFMRPQTRYQKHNFFRLLLEKQ